MLEAPDPQPRRAGGAMRRNATSQNPACRRRIACSPSAAARFPNAVSPNPLRNPRIRHRYYAVPTRRPVGELIWHRTHLRVGSNAGATCLDRDRSLVRHRENRPSLHRHPPRRDAGSMPGSVIAVHQEIHAAVRDLLMTLVFIVYRRGGRWPPSSSASER